MKFEKSLLPLLLTTFCLQSPSAPAASYAETQMRLIDSRMAKELADKPPSERFLANMTAGREAYQFRYYEKSYAYYANAIAIDVNLDKTEAHIKRIAIAVLANDQQRISDNLGEAKKYFFFHPEFKTEAIASYLDSIEQSLNVEPAAKSHGGGFFGVYVRDENFENLLKNKKYDQAFAMLDPEKVKHSDNSFHVIAYDMLNVLRNGKKVKNLYCNQVYEQYPKAYTYDMLLCGLLNDYLKTGTFSGQKMQRTRTYFAEEDRDRSWMLGMIGDMK